MLLSACTRDQYHFDNIDSSSISPSIGLPLVDAKLGLGKMVLNPSSSDILSVDNDSLIHIIFAQSLQGIATEELLDTLPNISVEQSNAMEAISIDGFSNSSSIALSEVVNGLGDAEKSAIEAADENGTNAPFPAFNQDLNTSNQLDEIDNFDQITFTQGSMSLTVSNNWPFEIQNLVIEILNEDNTPLASFTFTSIAAGATETLIEDLAGKTMDNQLTTRVGSIESPGSGGDVPIDLDQTLSLDFIAQDLTVASGMVVIPSMDIVNDTINNELSLDSTMQIHSFSLAAGNLNLEVLYEIQEACILNFSIPSATLNGIAFNKTIEIDPSKSTTYNRNWDLTDYVFDLSDSDSGSYIQAVIAASIVSSGLAVEFDTAQNVNINMQMGDFEIDYLRGYLGSSIQSFAADPIDFNLGADVLPGDIELAQPSLSMRFANSFGLPFALDLSGLYANGENQTVNLSGSIVENPAVISAPSIDNIGDSVISIIALNNETSNIAEILNSKPTSLVPAISIITNPDGYTDSNFIASSSKLNAYIDVDIPLYAKISNFGLSDTIDFEIETSSLDGIQEAILKANFSNGFPVEMIIQLYFCQEDEYGDLIKLDSLVSGNNRVDAANLDDNGNFISNGESSLSVVANSNTLDNLSKSNKLLIDFSVQSPENGTKAGKFYTTSEMGIQLGLITTINPFGFGGGNGQ